MKLLEKIFSVKNENTHKVINVTGIKISLKRKDKTNLYSKKYKKELKQAYKLLQDKDSKKIFKARVNFLDSLDIVKDRIPKSVFEEYLHPQVELKSGDIIIDAGVSDWLEPTYQFAQLVGEHGKVIGFEPEPQCYQKAVYEISQSEYKNILIEPYGLWNKQDTLKISQEGRGSTVMYAQPEAKLVDCKLLTLDEYLKNNNIEKVDFIKMDIEGAEPEAIEGSVNTLKNLTPNLAICVYHKPEHLFSIILYLNSLNLEYDFWLGHHRENEWSTVLYAKSRKHK